MSIEKRRSGDGLDQMKASEWNQLADTNDLAGKLRRLAAVSNLRALQSTAVFQVKNSTGGNVERFGVMGVGDPIYGPTDNLDEFKTRVSFTGLLPTFANHIGRFCIALEPIAAGKIGKCVFAGVTVAKVSVSHVRESYADIINGNTAKLQSAASGSAKILWKESGVGDKWAVVQLNSDFGVVLFELAENMPLGGNATANVLQWDLSSSTFMPTGPVIEVGDPSVVTGQMFGGPQGFRGAATMMKSGSPNAHEILWLESYARLAEVTTQSQISGGETLASVNTYTQGRQTPATVKLADILGIYEGYPAGVEMVAVYDDIASSQANWNPPVYVIVDASAAFISGASCYDDRQQEFTVEDDIAPTRVLHARKNSSLRTLKSTADPTKAILDIKRGSASNTVFSARRVDGQDDAPKWDSSPGIHSLSASAWLQVGHVYFVSPNEQVEGTQKWALPPAMPDCKARLYAENTGGDGVQLGWESPGLTVDGYMYFHASDESCDDVECRHVSFVRGQLVSIEGQQDTPPQCSDPQITINRPDPETPCEQ